MSRDAKFDVVSTKPYRGFGKTSVPREPTAYMLAAGLDAQMDGLSEHTVRQIWQAMHDAATMKG